MSGSSHPTRHLGGLVAVALLTAAIVVPVSMLQAGARPGESTTVLGDAVAPQVIGTRAEEVREVEAAPRERAAPARPRPRQTRRATGSFIWPVGGPWAITSPFGPRGDDDVHHGLDIGCAEGQAIRASFAGRVGFVGDGRAYGQTVLLDHGRTWQTLYGHLSAFDVAPGDVVAQGDIIGRCGSTGRSTGPHLHFEIRYDGYVWDPAHYLGR